MSTNNTLGRHFRLWRQRRGHTLKEAAGDIVSPQFLSQFERGKTSISADNLLLLLMSIGIDPMDFFFDYKGARVISYQEYITTKNDTIIQDYQNFPYLSQLAEFFITNVKKTFLITLEEPEPLSQYILSTLANQKYPNNLEYEIIIQLTSDYKIFSEEELRTITYNLLEIFEKIVNSSAIEISSLYSTFGYCIFLVRHHSRQGNYSEALNLIQKLRKIYQQLPMHYQPLTNTTQLLTLDFQEVYTWLRMGELTKAQLGYQRIVAFLDATIAFNVNKAYTELITEYRANFKGDFHRLLREFQEQNK